MQVGIDIPSIKATLSDREYRFITSVAGANFGEPLRLPEAALWLEDALLEEPMEDAESEPTPSMQVGRSGLHHRCIMCCMLELCVSPRSWAIYTGAYILQKSCHINAAKKELVGLVQVSRSAESAPATGDRQGSITAGKPAKRLPSGKKDRMAIRVLINIGKSELEMLRTSNAATGALSPLARFTIGHLWVLFRCAAVFSRAFHVLMKF